MDTSPGQPSNSPSEPDRRTELAHDRTAAAWQRTVLAEQRTYSAWLRTGMASAATGYAIFKFMSDSGPPWLVRLLAALFIVVGAAMFALGFWAYRTALAKLGPSARGILPVWLLGLISLGLLVGTLAGLLLVIGAVGPSG